MISWAPTRPMRVLFIAHDSYNTWQNFLLQRWHWHERAKWSLYAVMRSRSCQLGGSAAVWPCTASDSPLQLLSQRLSKLCHLLTRDDTKANVKWHHQPFYSWISRKTRSSITRKRLKSKQKYSLTSRNQIRQSISQRVEPRSHLFSSLSLPDSGEEPARRLPRRRNDVHYILPLEERQTDFLLSAVNILPNSI